MTNLLLEEQYPNSALAVGSVNNGSGGPEGRDDRGCNAEQTAAAVYARLDGWLRVFWFEEDGASCACLMIRDNAWPPDKAFGAVTMWLFWFLGWVCLSSLSFRLYFKADHCLI
ncbi:hypothetical protein EDB85DRAFT_1904920 [Lactarius pseudohatsudake]|nr:hypothetical protein EDB85DRAFT_1904920 [Lactarius pseudohatsudake]